MTSSTTSAAATRAEAIDAGTTAVPLSLGHGLAALGRLAKTVAASPGLVARKGAGVALEVGQVVVGRSSIVPGTDNRLAHPAYTENPLYRRLGQGYLACRSGVYELIDELDLDDKSRLRSRFVAALGVEALAPTNNLLGNPAALERAFETGGRSLVDGARHALHDIRHNKAMPSMVDTRPFVVGETIATTPGAVIFRNDVIEVIQYRPTTPKVHTRPLFVVPPQINKYYILDLAPGRSLVEHAVAHGQQVFMISWRNPGPEHRDWDLETYVSAISDGMDAALEITGSSDLNVLGVCAGGITTAVLAGYFAALGDLRIHALTFLVTVLDWNRPSTIGALASGPSIKTSKDRSTRAGIVDGRELARFFAWLRPNDLVWNYWVNNYLLGKNPPAFDVLSWNVDSTNLPAGLHHDFLTIATENALAHPGGVMVFDHKVDLSAITADTYVVGAISDHITPWDGCYQTVNLLGGPTEFVLSSSGHVQVMVNPPGNPKARYFTNPVNADTAEEWLECATEQTGTWWDHWMSWLSSRSGPTRNARRTLGSRVNRTIEDAPGRYVRS